MKKLILKIIFQEDKFLYKNNKNEDNKFELNVLSNKIKVNLNDVFFNEYLKNAFNELNELEIPIPMNNIFFKLNNSYIEEAIKIEYLLKNNEKYELDNEFDKIISIYLIAIIFKLNLLIDYFKENVIYECYNLRLIFYFFIITLYYNNYLEILMELYFIINYFLIYPKEIKLEEKFELNKSEEILYYKNDYENIIFNYSKFKNTIKISYNLFLKNNYYNVSENFEVTYNYKNKIKNILEFEMLNYNKEKIFESKIIDGYYRIFKNNKVNTLFSIKFLGTIYYSVSNLKFYLYNKFYNFDLFYILNNNIKNDFRINKITSKANFLSSDARHFEVYIYNINNLKEYLNLKTKKPIYNYEREVYELDLFKQSKHASTKNFELIENKNNNKKKEDDLDIYYVHCKIDSGKFIIHFRDPFNYLQSFFISIVSNIKKTLE